MTLTRVRGVATKVWTVVTLASGRLSSDAPAAFASAMALMSRLRSVTWPAPSMYSGSGMRTPPAFKVAIARTMSSSLLKYPAWRRYVPSSTMYATSSSVMVPMFVDIVNVELLYGCTASTIVVGPPGPLFHARPFSVACEVTPRWPSTASTADFMRSRERLTESVRSTVDTKTWPRCPTCGREFQPASFEEDRVMSRPHATNTVVRIEAMAGKVRWPLRTASRSARRILIDARRLGRRHRVKM